MRNMTVLVKPASSACNLNCRYCFYRDEANSRCISGTGSMSMDTAENLIGKVVAFCKEDSVISFMFQGGEPLLAGLQFFEGFVSLAENLKTCGSSFNWSVQTNGTLLNDEFCEFFKRNNFLVGVSLDGKKPLHDKYRSESFDRAMNGIELLRKHGVDFNILSVITADTDASELFDFYIENDFRDVQPIYCLDPLGGEKSEYSLGARELARFQKRLFNRWFSAVNNGERMYIRDFDNILSLLTTGKAEQCGASGRCNAQLVVEADGTCYPCDFYCLDEFECLNINTASVEDILNCDGLRRFFEHTEPENRLCPECPVKSICGSGCKRYRSLYNRLDGYCPRMDALIHIIEKIKSIRR